MRHGDKTVLCAFDLIELDGEDLRRVPIEQRKRKLAKLVRGPHPGIVLNDHYDGDGEIVFAHPCKLGCEAIVSKRLGSPYRSSRLAHWKKSKSASGKAHGRRGLGFPALDQEPQADSSHARGVLRPEEPGRRSAAKLLTKDEARRVAEIIAKFPELVGPA